MLVAVYMRKKHHKHNVTRKISCEDTAMDAGGVHIYRCLLNYIHSAALIFSLVFSLGEWRGGLFHALDPESADDINAEKDLRFSLNCTKVY